MKKIITVLLVLSAIAVGGALFCYNAFYGNCVRESHSLYIRSTDSYTSVKDSVDLYITHKWAYDIYAKRLSLAQSLKHGHYVLKPGMSVIEVVRMLKLGLQTPVKVTMNNVKTPAYLAGKLAKQLEADSVQIAAALTDNATAERLGFSNPLTMFSIFLPNTYEFYWTVSPEDFIDRMCGEYKKFWADGRDAKRARCGLNRVEVSTLASIVYEETRKTDEMPRIAGVYINRLRKGIPLQADPTIKYAMQDFGLRRILYRHLKYESPYNTYINRGLPPSPICMPSVEAIDAVLNFEQHDYIYFCARPAFDGYHNFARTLSEHNANARAYSRELDKRKIK